MNVIYPFRMAALLLAQHERLRVQLDVLVACARAPDLPALREHVNAFATELEHHNRLEDRLLDPLLRAADAWGPERIALMVDHHQAEHAALAAELARSIVPDDAAATAAAIEALADALRRHMALEEQEFLNERVLRDDTVALDASGG